MTVGVVGLGYVGLPLAVRARERGYEVIGFDLDEQKIHSSAKGKKSPLEDRYLEEHLPQHPFSTSSDPRTLRQADIILVCVPTPVDELYAPDRHAGYRRHGDWVAN